MKRLEDVLDIADIFITATGNKNIITAEHMARMKHQAIVGNIGHFDNEIDMAGLAKMSDVQRINIKPQVDEYVFPDGHSVLVLAEGRLLNLGCATGHPSFVMSNSFTNQVIAQIELYCHPDAYERTVYTLPKHLDEKVARLHLDALGVRLTELTEEQADYLGVPATGRTSPSTTATERARRDPGTPVVPGSRRASGRARPLPTMRGPRRRRGGTAMSRFDIGGGRDPVPAALEWGGDRIRYVDQRQLPGELVTAEVRTVDHLCEAISTLAIRGAPSLGAAGALGVALAAVLGQPLDETVEQLIATRPTAVNLAWGARLAAAATDPVASAVGIVEEIVADNRALGAHGATVRPRGVPGAHPLQRRWPRVRRLRNCARCDPRRARGGAQRVGVGGRDPAAAPGGPPHGLGARPPRHPGDGHPRRRRCVTHGRR